MAYACCGVMALPRALRRGAKGRRGQHIHRRKIRSRERGHIIKYRCAWPVPGEDAPTKRIYLAKPLMSEARPVEAEVT